MLSDPFFKTRRQRQQDEKRRREAFTLLQSQPAFKDSELWFSEQLRALQGQSPSIAELQKMKEARAELALKSFDLRSESWSRLVTNIQTYEAFVAMLDRAAEDAWLLFSGYPLLFRPPLQDDDPFVNEMLRRLQEWKREGLKRIERAEGNSTQEAVDAKKSKHVKANRTRLTWEDIEIGFTSDHRVQVKTDTENVTLNYADMGFVDKRTGNPNQAWGILQELARGRGMLPNNARKGADWIAFEKQIERVRVALRKHFGLTTDPLPKDYGGAYRARFKIELTPSFER